MADFLTTLLRLFAIVIVQVTVASFLFVVDKKKNIFNFGYAKRQIFFGIIFGILSVIGSEFGVSIQGAVINVRDAAPICASFLFGGPAGIIAGVIGGLERWFAVYWGAGMYSRFACTVSTILAGILSALLKKYLFDNKIPPVFYALGITVVIEVIHMLILLVTKSNDIMYALMVVQKSIGYMACANSLSVFFALILPQEILRDKSVKKPLKTSISTEFQKGLMICISFALILSVAFVWNMETRLAFSNAKQTLSHSIEDITLEIKESSDEKLLEMAYNVVEDINLEYSEDELTAINSLFLNNIISKYVLSEINIVDNSGKVISSTDETNIGLNLADSKQSREFLVLLRDTEDYVQEYMERGLTDKAKRKYAGVKYKNGFVQVAYDAESYIESLKTTIINTIRHRRVGNDGSLILAETNGEILYDSQNSEGKNISSLGIDIINNRPYTSYSANPYGVQSIYMFGKSDEYCVIAILPVSEILNSRDLAMFLISFMEIIVYGILFGLLYFLIKKVIIENINKTNRSLALITSGNLDEKVDINENEEFKSLSNYINATVDTLKTYIKDAEQRIASELEFAKAIQHSSLPTTESFAANHDFNIYALMQTAKEVGGDFYDFYFTPNGKLAFLIADVSGKGIPAALFMMRSKTMIKNIAESQEDVGKVFTAANNRLCEGNDAEMFVTAWMGELDLETGILNIANAGHNPPLIRRGNTDFEYLVNKAGLVLAGMDGIQYRTETLQLKPGDKLYLYTDGVTEATNTNKELYGEERLLSTINKNKFKSVEDICKIINDDVSNFVGSAPQFDDITMVCVEYTKNCNSIIVDANMDNHSRVISFVEDYLRRINAKEDVIYKVDIAVDEIYSNIVYYAYNEEDLDKTCKICVDYDKNENAVSVSFIDKGMPYNPLTKEDPNTSASIEDRKIGGLGIFMVKKSMDKLDYKYENNENHFTITKNL